MIKVNNIFKQFDGKYVLNDVNLQINPGESFTIIGPSGCGKSTLLKLLIGLIRPDRGSILIDAEDITQLPEEKLSAVRSRFGFVFQGAALFDSMSVYQNVAFGLIEHKLSNKAYLDRVVSEKLEWVGLKGYEDYSPAELSGGMKKRVSIARALAVEPEIILYDEPTTGLDPLVSKNIEELIVRLKQELKLTSIVVTHQISTIFRVSDRIVYLSNGKLIEVGSPQKLKEEGLVEEVRNFINAGLMV